MYFFFSKCFVEIQFGLCIKALQSNWGREYRPFLPILIKHGIHFRHPCPHVHQQHGHVEHKHRRVVECGLTLLAQTQLPLYF